MFAILLGALACATFEVPDGYLEACSGEGDTGCAAGLSCFASPGPPEDGAFICSSACAEDSDCPTGTKACGDGDAAQCRQGVCWYSPLCY
jgi:hypothetical protein